MSDKRRIEPEQWADQLANTDGYQLVVAGPGTGKTEFLVRRVAKIIESEKASREEILVLTFSRRGARKIADRIEAIVGGSTTPIESSTFHSLALRFLESLEPGETPPTPLTTPEQVGLVKELLETEDPHNWPINYRGVLTSTGFAEEVADFLMRCSERLLTSADLEKKAAERADWRGIPGFYARYLEELEIRGRIDYATLLVAAVNHLEEPDSDLSAKFKYILVDEYQDTSPAQARMASLLSAPHGNLTVAGDPYQSIYSFRGSEVRNIADFEDAHQPVTRIVLEKSFRVPAAIMEAALRVVSGGELPGAAGPVIPASHPGRVETYVFDQETAESEWIASQIERSIHVEGTSPRDLAILVRSKREMLNELSRSLDRRGIPHDRPDRRLVDHPAVRLVADLVSVAAMGAAPQSSREEQETDQAMSRVMLGPIVGLGLGELRSVTAQKYRHGDWAAVVRQVPALRGLEFVLTDPSWATDVAAADGFWHLWTSVPDFATLVNDPARNEWRSAMASFAQVLDRQADRDPDLSLSGFFELAEDESFEATPLLSHHRTTHSVTLTTLHQAKGLEFEEVFIANAVEGVFPDLRRSRRMLRPELLSPERTTDPTAVSHFQVQEEMRLAYTAMTRARRRLVWTATDAGVDQGEQRPSRFLLAASGKSTFSDIGRPKQIEQEPVTIGEAQGHLRRTASDPAIPPHERLAAISVLAHPPIEAWDALRFAGVPRPGPNAPILEALPSLSPSQAELYRRCPRRYALERRLRLGDPTSVYMQSGSLIHAALEDAEQQIIGTGLRHNTLEAALDALRGHWQAVDFGTQPLNRAWLSKAEGVITKLYERWPESAGVPVDLEKRVSLEVDGVLWHGVIDRLEQVDNGLRVIDYKTGGSTVTHEEAEVSIQLGFYALAINADESTPNVVAAELWYPGYKKSVSLTTRSLKVDRLPEIEETIRELTAAITEERWEPRVSSLCNKCAYKSSCPAWPEGRGAFVP